VLMGRCGVYFCGRILKLVLMRFDNFQLATNT
jgi:hypothetical protein